jgi:mercuric reductase
MAGLVDGCYDTSTTALALPRLPASMIVVGGGYVGLEYGQLFANLGTRVTLVETLDRLAQTEEPEVGEAIEAVLAADGVETHTGTTITAACRSGDEHVLRATRGAEQFELRAERLLMATGRLPVTAGLGLERVGVRIGARGEIVVDEYLRTGNERIWAAGDVTGSPQFVYVAGAQGTAVAANALGGTVQRLDYRHLPRVTFTTPAIAAAGLTEAQAVAQGIDADCRVLPLRYVPRALVNRDTRGLIKLVADRRSGQVLGVHVLAEGAGELIATAVHVLAGGMTVHQLADGWCPYLTTAEGLKLAAKAYSTDVAKLSCCA